MNLYIYPPVIMYLLGMILVIGMFESMDDNNKGTLMAMVNVIPVVDHIHLRICHKHMIGLSRSTHSRKGESLWKYP